MALFGLPLAIVWGVILKHRIIPRMERIGIFASLEILIIEEVVRYPTGISTCRTFSSSLAPFYAATSTIYTYLKIHHCQVYIST